MFFEKPWIDIWISVQFSPPFIPNTFFAAIIIVVNSHTVLVCSIPGWNTLTTCKVFMISGTKMFQNATFFRWWWLRLAQDTDLGVRAGDVG